MKRLFNYFLILLLMVFTGSTAKAQSASNTTDNKKNAKAAKNDAATNIPDDSSMINNDGGAAMPTMEVYPNPTDGMLTIKTVCAGRLYFYSQKGKPKGSCIVNEGVNPIYLETVLNPGVYTCKFEGVNGSSAETKITYNSKLKL